MINRDWIRSMMKKYKIKPIKTWFGERLPTVRETKDALIFIENSTREDVKQNRIKMQKLHPHTFKPGLSP